MRVSVRVRDAQIIVDVGPGHQRLKWLAMVALQRYAESTSTDGSIIFSQAQVATGLIDAEGNELPPNKSIRVALTDGQEVFALLQADEDDGGAVKGSKGTSRFLMMQGAAPSKCIISGPGVTYALINQAVFFSLQARDTYGNLTSNGGEKFEVRVSPPDSLTAKQLQESAPDPPAVITDRGDGSYLVSHTMTRKGRYDVSVELDGEPIAGSPFATVAVKTFVPPMIKWMQPRIGAAGSGAEPEGFAHGAVCTYGRSLIMFGGKSESVKPGVEGVPYHNTLFTLHVEKMRWEVPKVNGRPPTPRGGTTSCLNGNRFLIYGGEIDGEKEPPKSDCTPSDELWSLDLEQATWTNCQIRGVSPGPLSFGAAACVGNKAFFFGGWNGTEATNGLYTLDAVSLMWEPLEDNPSGPRPSARWGHSLLAVEDKLIMYGGRDALMHFQTLSIYDTVSETWSSPATRGDICRERAFHTSLLWGRNFVVGLGSDGQNDANVVSMLNLDTLYWDSWDGNVARQGCAMGLLEGKLMAIGGFSGKEYFKDVHQFNMGGYMMMFDGVDDEIMIPHLPTIITTQYTIEAWVKPSKVGPMNIVTRSDESYPMAAWSHQLRINSEGKLEHYLEADDKYTVSHTVPVTPGQWYHVAGVAVADDEMRLFVDGQEEGNPVHIGALRQKLDRYFVGSASGDGMGYFEGIIAEVRVWNLPRPEDEISVESRKVLNGTERGLVGYWRINEGPGAMIFDFSSYNNVGPVKGEPNWTANMVPLSEASN